MTQPVWPQRRGTRHWLRLGIPAACGLALRLVFAVGVHQPTPPRGCAVDPRWFRQQAALLVRGHLFVDPCAALRGSFVPGANHPPVFSALLALADLAGLHSMDAQRALLAVVSSSAVVLSALVAREVGGRRAEVPAAWAAALLPGMWVFGAQVISETLVVPLVAATVLVALRMHRSPRMVTAVGLGVLCALAAMARSELAVLGVVFAPLFVRKLDWRRRIGQSAAYSAAIVLLVGPWVGRNITYFRRPELVSVQLGATMAGGACKESFYGPSMGTWQVACTTLHDPHVVTSDASVQDYALRDRAISYTRHHLGRLGAVVAAREARAFEVWPRQLNSAVWDLLAAGGWPLWAGWLYHDVSMITLPLWLATLWWLRRKRARTWILVAPIGLYAFVSGVLSSDSRYSSDCQACFAVLVGVGIAAAWAWTFERGPLLPPRAPRPNPRPSRIPARGAPGVRP